LLDSCTDSIKPSLQFLCNFVVINASEGSHCFQNFKHSGMTKIVKADGKFIKQTESLAE
jgi:hypothetical protein